MTILEVEEGLLTKGILLANEESEVLFNSYGNISGNCVASTPLRLGMVCSAVLSSFPSPTGTERFESEVLPKAHPVPRGFSSSLPPNPRVPALYGPVSGDKR